MIPALLLALLGAQTDSEKEILRFIEELKLDDASARRKALDGLLERAKEAVPLAIAVLADERPGLEAQIDDCVKQLSDREWKTRDAATKALARLGRHARPHLQPHREATDPEVAWRVKAALAEIEQREKTESVLDAQRNAGLCEFLGHAADARAVPHLLKQLEAVASSTPDLGGVQAAVRLRAVEALGRLRGALTTEQAVSATEHALYALTGTRDRRSGVIVVQTLGRLKSANAVTPLIGLVRDADRRDLHLKRAALRALGAIGDERAVAAVISTLRADDVYVRDAAIDALAELGAGELGLDPRQSPDAAATAIRAAQQWWEKQFGKEWTD